MSVELPRTRSLSLALRAMGAILASLLLSASSAFAEVASEPPETGVATNVDAGTAVLNGVLNPHSKSNAAWYFAYRPGSSASCGVRLEEGPRGQRETSIEPAGEVEDDPVHAEVNGLLPGTLYTFCLIHEVGGNIPVVGAEAHFTTKGVVPPPFGTEGSGFGDLDEPRGVGVDEASGDVYVGDEKNYRIDVFGSSGGFLEAWGWDVNAAAPVNGSQVCTTSCQRGSPGPGAGQFASGTGGQGAQGLAVDNDPLSFSYGDVYAADFENHRVEKFSASGQFLLMFGGNVNETTGGDVCVAGEKCKRGAEGTADGQFEWAFQHSYIAVGPGGAVYVGDRARVQVFEPSGKWRESVSLAGLSTEGKVTALAVDAAGDLFLADQEVPGVRELAPNGTEKAEFDAGSDSIEAIALDPSGDLFVGDSGGGFHILKYSPSGQELDSFASHTLAETGGMAFSESGGAPGQLYVSDPLQDDVGSCRSPRPARWSSRAASLPPRVRRAPRRSKRPSTPRAMKRRTASSTSTRPRSRRMDMRVQRVRRRCLSGRALKTSRPAST